MLASCNEMSYDLWIMEHSEHSLKEQNRVYPLSPIVQARRVPCQRRRSFPLDSPAATKFPWDSTFSLQNSAQFCVVADTNCCGYYLPICIICSKWSWRPINFVHMPHTWASRLMPPRYFELISHYGRESENMRRKFKLENLPLLNVASVEGSSEIVVPLLWTVTSVWRRPPGFASAAHVLPQ